MNVYSHNRHFDRYDRTRACFSQSVEATNARLMRVIKDVIIHDGTPQIG
jgi:hypothetical protein